MQKWEYMQVSYRYQPRIRNTSFIIISPSNMLNTDWFGKIFPNSTIKLKEQNLLK